jgi:hypothetical protein
MCLCASLSLVVSNRGMRQIIRNLWALLLTVCLWAQPSPANKTEKAAIRHANNAVVSSFDHSLPNVTLEFFLMNEGGGAPVKWEVNDCEQTRNPATYRGRDSSVCVEASLDAKDGAVVTVLVSVGTSEKGPSGLPALFRVTITDLSGESRIVPHLSDLPMELHRPAPRLPRDLPVPVGALFVGAQPREDRPAV